MRIDKGHRKNHYVPIWYLKNFVDSKGKIYVFDKQAMYKSKEILEKTPSQICFEHNRYLIKSLKGDEATILETKTYGNFDAQHSKVFKLINEWDGNSDVWTQEVINCLEMFVPLQYWRSPASDEEFTNMLKNAKSLEEFGLVVNKGKNSPRITNRKIHAIMLKDRNMDQVLRPLLAMSTFGKGNHPIHDKLEWRIIEHQTGKPNLTSDNPILFKNHPKVQADYRSCVVIPIGQVKTLVRINKELEDNFHLQVWQDMLQIHQAKRYVLSADKEYLMGCINEFRKRDFKSNFNELKKKVFGSYFDKPIKK